MTTVVAVIQARATSTRLPGKVLMELGGKTVLGQLVTRASSASTVNRVVVATSLESSDDPVADECRRLGVACVRGSLEDVLERCAGAFRAYPGDVGVRLTADCPLHDPAVIDRAVAVFRASDVDYASNVDERTYPDGLDVEVFAVEALLRAERRAATRYEREHVTPWLRRHCRKRSFVQEEDLSSLRWTLDDARDLAFMRRAFDVLGTASFPAREVYRWLIATPDAIHVAAGAPDREELVRRMQALTERETTRRDDVRDE